MALRGLETLVLEQRHQSGAQRYQDGDPRDDERDCRSGVRAARNLYLLSLCSPSKRKSFLIQVETNVGLLVRSIKNAGNADAPQFRTAARSPVRPLVVPVPLASALPLNPQRAGERNRNLRRPPGGGEPALSPDVAKAGRSELQSQDRVWAGWDCMTVKARRNVHKVMRSCCMSTDTGSLSREEFDRHVRMYRRFVWGVGLFAAHTLVILLLIYYFLHRAFPSGPVP